MLKEETIIDWEEGPAFDKVPQVVLLDEVTLRLGSDP